MAFDDFPGVSSEIKRLAEIHPPDFRILRELIRAAAAENLSRADDIGAIRDAQRFANVVIRHEDSQPVALQIQNDLLKLDHLDRIDARKRLVKQQEAGIDSE